jgi:hypothetical protein
VHSSCHPGIFTESAKYLTFLQQCCLPFEHANQLAAALFTVKIDSSYSVVLHQNLSLSTKHGGDYKTGISFRFLDITFNLLSYSRLSAIYVVQFAVQASVYSE